MEPVTKYLIIIEGDDDTYPYVEKVKYQNKIKEDEIAGTFIFSLALNLITLLSHFLSTQYLSLSIFIINIYYQYYFQYYYY